MSNFELIDDYLANRLNELERNSFEQQLAGDPALKEEVQFQQRIIEGVRQARAAELKSMLKNVPLNGNTWSPGKLTTAAVTVGIVATSLYFYLKDDQAIVPAPDVSIPESVQPSEPTQETVVQPAESTDEPVSDSEKPTEKPATRPEAATLKEPISKPKIQVADPGVELTETDRVVEDSAPDRNDISPSKMEVVTGIQDKKHNFHYQFTDNKLLLYGPFDNSLYEILEIHGDGHAVFLYYKTNYYLLDEQQTAITPLEPIRNGPLLKKLREYQGR